MYLIALHKSFHKFGTATRKWGRLWSFCNSIYHVSSIWQKPTIMVIQCVNVSLMRQHLVKCLEKEMMHPFPKEGSVERVLECKKRSIVT